MLDIAPDVKLHLVLFQGVCPRCLLPHQQLQLLTFVVVLTKGLSFCSTQLEMQLSFLEHIC